MIDLQQMTFGYAREAPIFAGFDWHVERGERWAVLGPSGCGKSTLLYLLAGLYRPTAGAITIAGETQTGPRPRTGLILQDYGLLPWSTAYDNVVLGLDIRTLYGPDGKHAPLEDNGVRLRRLAELWMERLGLTRHADKYPSQLSGGQRQRVAIARTLTLQPDLLLMDEPFSSLDAPTREDLQNLTLELADEADLTLVIVTHTIEEAAVMGQRILLLRDPPNTAPQIVENPHANADFRHQPAYLEMCRQLRDRLEPSP